ncbi:MAG: flavin reductase family protein [Elusimicrobia bacterium]|nr:flavin reductase family protein [Elusimicrobiota bacterium]
MKEIKLNKVNTFLQSGPVILLSTNYKGKNNFMPMSWHTMIDFDPPLIGVVVGRESFTHKALLKTKEAAINIPSVKMIKQSLLAGKISGSKTDKFIKTGLEAIKASGVKAPLIEGCQACMECVLHDYSMAKKYDFFILRVVKAYLNESVKITDTFRHITGDMFMLGGKIKKVR